MGKTDIDYVYKEKERTLKSHNYNSRSEDEKRVLTHKADSLFLDPLQIMYYITMPDGTRVADSGVVAGLQPIVDIVAFKIKDRKVRAVWDKEKGSISPKDPMDEVIDYDKLFDEWARILEEGKEEQHETISADKSTGSMKITTMDGKTIHIEVKKSPLTFEVSKKNSAGESVANNALKLRVQLEIDKVMKTLESSGGWLW